MNDIIKMAFASRYYLTKEYECKDFIKFAASLPKTAHKDICMDIPFEKKCVIYSFGLDFIFY